MRLLAIAAVLLFSASASAQGYQAHPADEAVHVRMIARHIPPAPFDPEVIRRTMEKMRARIAAGADFGEIARQETDGPNPVGGGDLGWVRHGEFSHEIEEAAFALNNPGELSPVFESEGAFFLLQLVEKPAPAMTLPAQTPLPTETPVIAPAPEPAATPIFPYDWTPRISQWPLEITVGYVQGLGNRTMSPALDGSKIQDATSIEASGDYSPIHGLAIGGDFLVDDTQTQLVSAGNEGCSSFVLLASGSRCQVFTNDVWHVTQSYLVTLWARPYFTTGPVRIWGGAGVGVGTVNYFYASDPANVSGSYGQGTTSAFTASAGVGADYAYPIAPNGASVAISTSLQAGAARFSENIPGLFFAGSAWNSSNVGNMAAPLRFQIGIGVTFPTAHPPGRQ